MLSVYASAPEECLERPPAALPGGMPDPAARQSVQPVLQARI